MRGVQCALAAAVALACGLLAACAGSDDASGGERDHTSGGVTTTELYTGPASDLAPSQRAQPTVPPPTVPDHCTLDSLAIDASLGTASSAPVVVVFGNVSRARCEVDLGTVWATEHSVEPSVWLEPGAEAELWGAGESCPAGRAAEWALTVNGEDVALALPAGAPCDVVPTAFFPR